MHAGAKSPAGRCTLQDNSAASPLQRPAQRINRKRTDRPSARSSQPNWPSQSSTLSKQTQIAKFRDDHDQSLIPKPLNVKRKENATSPELFYEDLEQKGSLKSQLLRKPRGRPILVPINPNLRLQARNLPQQRPPLLNATLPNTQHCAIAASNRTSAHPKRLLWPSEQSQCELLSPTRQPQPWHKVPAQSFRQPTRVQTTRFPVKPTAAHLNSQPHESRPPHAQERSRAAARYDPNYSRKLKPRPLANMLPCKPQSPKKSISPPFRKNNPLDNSPLSKIGPRRRTSLMQKAVQRLPNSPLTPRAHDPDAGSNSGSMHLSSPSKNSTITEKDVISDPIVEISAEPQNAANPLKDAMRKLMRWEIWLYRIVLSAILISLNISLLVVYLTSPKHHYLLAFLVFMKSKDLLSTIAGVLGIFWSAIHDLVWTHKPVDSKWIMSLVCAYAESEEQIMKTIKSLAGQELVQHKQAICVILDGKPRDVLSHLTSVTHTMKRPYLTWKSARGQIQVFAGMLNKTPVIIVQKAKNAGKKDSLILGHDLFNYPRDDAPMDTKILRRDIFLHMLPALTGLEIFEGFDCVYSTDADSTIHKDCLKELANALSRNPKTIAACGIIVAELTNKKDEWSAWHLFQQFQYTFGQYVRRQAESVWGRVTCLPGPVTMIKVRPEMAGAISEYASPIKTGNLVLHQVQYQGTDRRLTWCMLSQNKHLQSILVIRAVGETVVPESLDHYLSQRRRWAANAYFNDYMYLFGKEQHPVTRLFAAIDVIRMSFVFYRVINTALFIRSLIRHFYIEKIIPTLVLTKTPTIWFLLLILARQPVLRKRLHKIICGIVLNQFMSPVLSVVVFSRVLLNMGNHAWGITGVSSKETKRFSMAYMPPSPPKSPWSPTKLVSIIKAAVQPPRPSRIQSFATQISTSRTPSVPSDHVPSVDSKTPSRNGSFDASDVLKLPPLPETPTLASSSSALPSTPLKGKGLGVTEDLVTGSTIRKRPRHPTFIDPTDQVAPS